MPALIFPYTCVVTWGISYSQVLFLSALRVPRGPGFVAHSLSDLLLVSYPLCSVLSEHKIDSCVTRSFLSGNIISAIMALLPPPWDTISTITALVASMLIWGWFFPPVTHIYHHLSY